MIIKKYISGDEARDKLFKGMSIVAEAVGASAGPSGRCITLQQPWGAPKITKDGVTISKSFALAGAEGEGAKLMIQASEKTGSQAGDGTTATCVIAEAIAKEGLKYINRGCKSTKIKQGIDTAVKEVVEYLKTKAETIKDNAQIRQIATISANGDEEIGNLIGQAIEKVGRTGVVTVEEAKGLKTELEVVEGMQIDQGYLSPYFMTNLEKSLVEFDNPFIFLYDGKINSLKQILPLLEEVSQTGNPIVFFVDECDDAPLGALIQNHLKGTLRSCVVKAPSFGDIRKSIMEDIAVLTGGQFISSILGKNLENLTTDCLGSCGHIKISPNETVIINGNGNKEEIQERAKTIQGEIDNTQSDYDREKLRERLARLTSGVAVIRVGGATEVEVNEKKDRVDDAACATRAALEEGILPGGGIALIRAKEYLNNPANRKVAVDKDFDIGYDIVMNTLSAPLKKIVENAGYAPDVVVEKVSNNTDFDYGFNASIGNYEKFYDTGVVDAMKVIRCSLENGASIAGSLLTVEGLVIDDIDEEIKMNQLNKMPQM